MSDSPTLASEVSALKTLILDFIQERQRDKMDKLKPGDESKRQEMLDTYRPQVWLADAAKRVAQIQLVNFGVKFTHPDARGSSLYLEGIGIQAADLIGTHSLSGESEGDAVGNAAALDVYKFLKLAHEDQNLLKRSIDGDAALRAALSDNPTQAKEWMRSFAAITSRRGALSSHTLAKQLYFPLPKSGYHLLAPLFPTSLAHKVYVTIQKDRFSDASKAARQAYREDQPWHQGYCEYPNLAIQKFGGTKPQNISQLNSERRGESYLLPSCPPNWQRAAIKPPTRMKSVFTGWFGRRPAVRELSHSLKDFLARASHNNRRIRQTRRDLVIAIRDELMQFAAELHELPAGWSAEPGCHLDTIEALWLDPYRAESDEDFARELRHGDWRGEVCSRFAKWLNSAIQTSRTPMGDAEYGEWHSDLEDEMRMISMEIGSDD